MLCGIVPFMARHPYDLRRPIVLSSQPSPVAGDSSELLRVPNGMYCRAGDSGGHWVSCLVRVGLTRLGRHGEVLFG